MAPPPHNLFVPLTTHQGIDATRFHHLTDGRSIIIWGAGVLGKCIFRLLEKWGCSGSVRGFCDKNASRQRLFLEGYPVIPPAEAIALAQQTHSLLVLASEKARHHMAAECKEAGLSANTDYLPYTALSRPEAVIEISSPHTPMSCVGSNAQTNMPLGLYTRILDKLLADIPGLFHVDLTGWGDPLDNLNVYEITSLTESRVPCSITTRLHSRVDFERLLAAGPTQLVVIASGFDTAYEAHNPGRRWEDFVNALTALASAWKHCAGKTELRMRFDMYGPHGERDARAFHDLCDTLGIPFVSTDGYFGPYDPLLVDLRTDSVSRSASVHGANLAWDLSTALELSLQDRALPCLCQRIFPVITSNGAVSLCHVYNTPTVTSSYLDLAYDSLLAARHSHPHCRICQHHGLHRLDIAVLRRRYVGSLKSPQG
jgi:hypothetical protein